MGDDIPKCDPITENNETAKTQRNSKKRHPLQAIYVSICLLPWGILIGANLPFIPGVLTVIAFAYLVGWVACLAFYDI